MKLKPLQIVWSSTFWFYFKQGQWGARTKNTLWQQSFQEHPIWNKVISQARIWDNHGPTNYKDTKAKWRHLKKLTCKRTLRQMLIYLRPPPLLGFCLGLSSTFVRSESGQLQTVKLLQNMVSNRTQHPLPPLTSHTHRKYIPYCTLTQGRGRAGRVEPERRLEGQQFTKLGRK